MVTTAPADLTRMLNAASADRRPSEQRVHDLALAGLQNAFSKADLNKLLAEGATLAVEAAARIALAD